MYSLFKRIKRKEYYRKLVPKIPLQEDVQLSAWEKFIKYKRFPFKFCVHFILLVLVTCQLFLFSENREQYLANVGTTITNTFLPEGYLSSAESKTGYNSYYFYNYKDIIDHVGDTVQKYYEFRKQSIAYLDNFNEDGEMDDIFKDEDYTPPTLDLTIERYHNLTFPITDLSTPLPKSIKIEKFSLDLNDTLGPFDDFETEEALQHYIYKLRYITLKFTYKNLFIKNEYPEILTWTVKLEYDFRGGAGVVPLILKYEVELFAGGASGDVAAKAAFSSPLTWISIFIIIFSIISSLLIARALYRSFRFVHKAMRKDKGIFKTLSKDSGEDGDGGESIPINGDGFSSNVSVISGISYAQSYYTIPSPSLGQNSNDEEFQPKLKHKLKFFNPWHILGLTGNIMNIASSSLVFTNVSYQYFSLDATNILLGLSAILVWSNIVQYFSHNPKFYVLIKALRKGLPNVVRFIVGATPILIGYALCGMVLFGSYSQYFRGFENSLITLFSSANGDALHDTFDLIYGQNLVIAYFSRIYLITFVCLFTYSVINIFILIMEDAYFSVKEAGLRKEEEKRRAEEEAEAKRKMDENNITLNNSIDHEDDNNNNDDNNDNSTNAPKTVPDKEKEEKIDNLIYLLSELRNDQLLDVKLNSQQKKLCEKVSKLLIMRGLLSKKANIINNKNKDLQQNKGSISPGVLSSSMTSPPVVTSSSIPLRTNKNKDHELIVNSYFSDVEFGSTSYNDEQL
ncbi:hypothetical protein ABK040_009833 [Willaertia magna]